MFQHVIPGGGGRNGGYDKYDDQIAVSVNKSGITLVGRCNEIFEGIEYVQLFKNNTEWAIKPVSGKAGAFKLSIWGRDRAERKNKWHIVAMKFIRDYGLTTNAIYVGKQVNGMIVFSKIPTEVF